MMTMAAVAEILATTPRQIRNMAGRGQFPAPMKVPGLGTRFRTVVVKAWLERIGGGGGEAVPA